MNNTYDWLFKLVMIGSSGVGKSSLLTRFSDDTFAEGFIATIGVDFKIKEVEVKNGKIVKLQIWDTAGQERFRSITKSYYAHASAVMICYDCTAPETFKDVSTWIDDVERYCKPDTVKVLVATKIDRIAYCNAHGLPTVSSQEAKDLVAARGIDLFLESSAKECTNVTQLFELISNTLVEKKANDIEFAQNNKKINKLPLDGSTINPTNAGTCMC